MKEYKPEILHRLWGVEKEIYLEFVRVCKKYDLRFFGAYGTALGAVRHGGFIPWDDDIDLCMPRPDYEKFIEVAPNELGDRFELLEPRLTKGYVLTFAKLTRSDTTLIEETDQNRKYHSGIFIDIFPMDVVYKDKKKRIKQLDKAWMIARLCVLSEYSSPKLPASISVWKRVIVLAGCKIIYGSFKLFRLNTVKLYKKYLKAMLSAEADGESELLTDLSMYRNEIQYGDDDICYSMEELFPTSAFPFDEISMEVPRDYQSYLLKTFGSDYMELPPEEERHAHYPSTLIFSDGARNE